MAPVCISISPFLRDSARRLTLAAPSLQCHTLLPRGIFQVCLCRRSLRQQQQKKCMRRRIISKLTMPHKTYTTTTITTPYGKAIATGAGGKPLPALYKSTGNEARDRLAFLHLLEQLKLQKRSGWIREGVEQPESVADHMYRMAMLAMVVPQVEGRPLDIGRCVQMALVHDLAEAHVGDITPVEGVSADVKHHLEQQAMDNFLEQMLGSEGCREARERIRSLWDEYEARETPESKLVKDLDRLELVLQAVEYERSQDVKTLPPFFTGSLPHLEHPAIREWANTLLEERRELRAARGITDDDLDRVVVGSATDAKLAAAANGE